MRIEGLQNQITWISTNQGRSIVAYANNMQVVDKQENHWHLMSLTSLSGTRVLMFTLMQQWLRHTAAGAWNRTTRQVIGCKSGYVPMPVEAGNIDIYNRTILRNADGTNSLVRTIGIRDGDLEVMIPTVGPNGEDWSEAEAIRFYRETGQHLGKYRNVRDASDSG